jgi:acyl-CoA thioester hydrolase
MKFVHEMRNDESGEIAAVCALTGVHIDTQTRKSCALPDEILHRGRELVVAYEFPGR